MRACNSGCVGCNAGVDFLVFKARQNRCGCYLKNCSSSALGVMQFGRKS